MSMTRGVTAVDRDWRDDPVAHAITLMVSLRESGQSHGIVGVRNVVTGMYVFHALPLVGCTGAGRLQLATSVLWHATAIDRDIRDGQY